MPISCRYVYVYMCTYKYIYQHVIYSLQNLTVIIWIMETSIQHLLYASLCSALCKYYFWHCSQQTHGVSTTPTPSTGGALVREVVNLAWSCNGLNLEPGARSPHVQWQVLLVPQTLCSAAENYLIVGTLYIGKNSVGQTTGGTACGEQGLKSRLPVALRYM